jgi:hyaluronate lyase
VGWAFLGGGANPALNTLIETREGSRAINQKNGNPAPLTMRFATLWFDHGKGTRNGSYAYVVLPGRTARATADYAEKPQVELLSNTPQLQAARLPQRGLTAIVGWEAGSVTDIAFDHPVLLVVQDTADTLSVAISDPTMLLSDPVRVQFTRDVREVRSSSDRIKLVSNSPLVIEFDPKGANGQSHRIDLTASR